VPDLANFGKIGSEKRLRFTSDLFLSAKIPRIFKPGAKAAEAEEEGDEMGEEEKYKTPLNMVIKDFFFFRDVKFF